MGCGVGAPVGGPWLKIPQRCDEGPGTGSTDVQQSTRATGHGDSGEAVGLLADWQAYRQTDQGQLQEQSLSSWSGPSSLIHKDGRQRDSGDAQCGTSYSPYEVDKWCNVQWLGFVWSSQDRPVRISNFGSGLR
jgi:hypothetical protein